MITIDFEKIESEVRKKIMKITAKGEKKEVIDAEKLVKEIIDAIMDSFEE